MKEEEESLDKYLYYKKLVYGEILDDTKDELEEATEIKNILESKMLDGGEREHFMRHLIKCQTSIDALSLKKDELDIKINEC